MPGGWKKERTEKGKSLIALPLDYVVVDTETTGLGRYCSLIEASALRVRGGKVVDTFSSLIQPPRLDIYLNDQWISGFVDAFIIHLTGITNEMLEHAPKPKEIIPELAAFLGDDILLGHNVGFDIAFLYDAFLEHTGTPCRNDHLDTLRLSRKMFPELPHHRLGDISTYMAISYEGAHRAEADCHITNGCYLRMREKALQEGTEEDFIRLFDKKKKKPAAPKKPDYIPTVESFDKGHPLYRKTVTIVGKLHTMTREEAMQRIVDAGGKNSPTITKKTNYLVIPSTGSTAGGLAFQGEGVTVLSEQAFREMLGL